MQGRSWNVKWYIHILLCTVPESLFEEGGKRTIYVQYRGKAPFLYNLSCMCLLPLGGSFCHLIKTAGSPCHVGDSAGICYFAGPAGILHLAILVGVFCQLAILWLSGRFPGRIRAVLLNNYSGDFARRYDTYPETASRIRQVWEKHRLLVFLLTKAKAVRHNTGL